MGVRKALGGSLVYQLMGNLLKRDEVYLCMSCFETDIAGLEKATESGKLRRLKASL